MTKQHSKFSVFGLGPIGIEILRSAYQTNPHSIIGVIDIDPEKIGNDIGLLINEKQTGLNVVSSIQEVKTNTDHPVALHATGSNLQQVWPQIKELLDHGFSVVSTCEQLSFPWDRYPELAKEIDDYAKAKRLSVIGTGINPGFIMDTLVICFSTVLTTINKIIVNRRVDVSKRRIPLQKKVGIGMPKEEFESLAEQNKIGHVGLEESVRLIAYGLNWNLASVKNTIEPTITRENITVPLTSLKPGDVNGLHQVSKGKTSNGREICLDLTMSVGINQEDEIIIEGNETQRLIIPNGIFGDTATAAMVINTAKQIDAIRKPGLLTMADIGLPRNIYQSEFARI
ncbi:NAD(P)H-dependent amine dehydrogenase family protein [Peribacillus butanolivorans]|uniref:NAD(P)H-dependent amine dehydrogenase family protein n=1 Tax=Peribacillus butanolivorans TaxID=421767 RepID=UPI0036991A17